MNFNFGTPISASSAMIVGYSGPLAGNGFENQPAPQNSDMVDYFHTLKNSGLFVCVCVCSLFVLVFEKNILFKRKGKLI